ncbi:MAG TPA: MFS transporter [Candidatus Polarisedimenticolia bacterium]|jgi:PAT family beta-lactamase induction signal transducer AmpG
MTSWRTASVALLSFSSGLPLGVVWIAIPDWMRSAGIDIRVVGLLTLAQAPWSFKVLWSPLLDRFSPPWMGRRRGWIAIAQIALFGSTLALAGVGHRPDTAWVVGALAFAIALAAATQDIAYDAYTVDVLKPEEQGVAVGAKTFFYMTAFRGVGSVVIAIAAAWSWPVVNVCLALLYLPMILITWKAPEPPDAAKAPTTLREAIWQPFLGFLARHRALEILAFVFFYKFADNLATSLTRPFLSDMGYGAFDRGVRLTVVTWLGIVTGTIIGGILTDVIGLGHSLWIFGLLQIFSNIGYVIVARSEPSSLLMCGAAGFDNLTTGLGSGAFTVMLLRLTQKRFSATQYALFSSLFGLPRIVAGPITGFAVDAVGWETFFWSTLLAGIPGLLLLQRFCPLGTREPRLTIEPARARRPLSVVELTAGGIAGGAVGAALAAAIDATLAGLKGMSAAPGAAFDPVAGLMRLLRPADLSGWFETSGVLIFGLLTGLATAAILAARHGAGREAAADSHGHADP